MSDSSDDAELFGDSDNDQNHEEMERLNAIDPAPEYTTTQEFQNFCKEENITINAKYGYLFAHLYKPFYFPGEIVRGSIILDFFNDLPTNYKKVVFRLRG